MATNDRRSYSQAQEVSLTTQVGGYCPLCGDPLFYTKRRRDQKGYELAHIYPLNPNLIEAVELQGVVRLHSDVNHPDNIIPLCIACHSKFDKPRTVEEYERLAQIKRTLIEKAAQRALIKQYPIEEAIERIIAGLNEADFGEQNGPGLEFEAKSLGKKFDVSLPGITRRRIKHCVTDYYQQIKRSFGELERQSPTKSELIYSQVRTYYLKQKDLGLPQSEVFPNVVEWLRVTTHSQTPEAAEIVASFFVQNCEVFE